MWQKLEEGWLFVLMSQVMMMMMMIMTRMMIMIMMMMTNIIIRMINSHDSHQADKAWEEER